MDVTCDKCRTEYEFDESLISESGTTVKCTNCGHLFRIYRPGTPEASRRPAWMLRQPDGSVYTFERMTTLQRWIAEGKVSREDVVSRTGEDWESLGSMDDLRPFFESARTALEERDGEDWPDDDDGPTVRRQAAARAARRFGGEPTEMGMGSSRVASSGPERRDPTSSGYVPPRAPPPRQRSAPAVHANDPERDETLPAMAPPPPGKPLPGSLAVPMPADSPAMDAPMRQPEELGLDIARTQLKPAQPAAPPAQSPAPDGEWTQGALLEDKAPAWTGASGPPQHSEQEPAWTDGRRSAIDRPDDGEDDPPQKSRMLTVGVPILLIGLVVVGVGGFYLARPAMFHDLVNQLVTSEGGSEGASQAYLRGREHFLLDTKNGYSQADREYHRAGAEEGLPQAGLAEVYTTWSQYLLDRVADSRLRAEKLEGDEERARARARADIRNEQFQTKLQQARRFVDAALKHAPNTPEAQRAAADYYRLAGDFDQAETHITLALAKAQDNRHALPETQYVKALLDLSTDGDASAAVARLQSVVEQNDKLIRCHYRLARLLAATDQKGKAVESLQRVLDLNAEHLHAEDLMVDLRRPEPVLLAIASNTITPLHAAAAADGGVDGGIAGDAEAGVAVAAAPDAAPDAGTATNEEDAAAAGEETSGGGEESFDAIVRRAAKAQANGSREACGLFRRADKIRSGHAEVLVGLGYCASDSGNGSKAVRLFQRALSGNGRYGPALMALASAYRSQGNNSRALEYYRRYLQFHPSGSQAGMARRNVDNLEERLRAEEPPATETPGSVGEEPPITSPGATPPTETPPTPPAEGAPDNPTVTRSTEQAPTVTHSDSLATDSEPPLRPGENLD